MAPYYQSFRHSVLIYDWKQSFTLTFGMTAVILYYALNEAVISLSQIAWVNVVSDFLFFSGSYFFQMIKLSDIINKHTYTHSRLFKFWIMQTSILSEKRQELSSVNYRLLDKITINWFVSTSVINKQTKNFSN